MQIPSELQFAPVAHLAPDLTSVHTIVGEVLEEGFYASLFSKRFSLIPDVHLNLFDVCMGAGFILNALVSVKIFIDTFREREPKVNDYLVPLHREWDKVEVRVFSLFAAIGAVARFIDFGLDREWFASTLIYSVALKAIGGVSGFFVYGNRAITSLNHMKETGFLTEYAQQVGRYKPGQFDAYWYSEFFMFVANTSFMLYSGVQFTAACLCSVAALELSGTVLLAGMVSMGLGFMMRQMDHSVQERNILNLTCSASREIALQERSLVRY